jgi:dipeptide/tripeptide permease
METKPQTFEISIGMVKWIVGFAVTGVGLVTGWFVVWDRIDGHWRQESVQIAKDRESEAKEKQIHAEIAAVSKKAEVGRAWVLWSVQDTKAYTAAQFAMICRALKQPECAQKDTDAAQFRQDASEAKRSASEAGKDK